jgi:hypothetical protein
MVMEYAGGELFNFIVEKGKVIIILRRLFINLPILIYYIGFLFTLDVGR